MIRIQRSLGWLGVWALMCASGVACSDCRGGSGATREAPPNGSGDHSETTGSAVRALQANLRSVWGSAERDVWAVGDKGTIVHFDGTAWKASNSGTAENLTGVHGVGPNDVWACGDKGTILRWDGKAWAQASQAADKTLLSIWTSGPSDVWAVGMDPEGDAGFVYRWDGTKWSGQPIPGSTSVWEIAGSGPHDVWMVGTKPQGDGLVLRGDGSKFDVVGYDGPGVRGVAPLRPDDVWVAPYQGAMQHWNGSTWTKAVMPVNVSPLLRVEGSAPDDIWAVGLEGGAMHFRGGGWAGTPTGTKEVLWSVWSRTADQAWAVGNGGTILRWNGSSWNRQ